MKEVGGQIDPTPQEKLPSKSLALLGLRPVAEVHFVQTSNFIKSCKSFLTKSVRASYMNDRTS